MPLEQPGVTGYGQTLGTLQHPAVTSFSVRALFVWCLNHGSEIHFKWVYIQPFDQNAHLIEELNNPFVVETMFLMYTMLWQLQCRSGTYSRAHWPIQNMNKASAMMQQSNLSGNTSGSGGSFWPFLHAASRHVIGYTQRTTAAVATPAAKECETGLSGHGRKLQVKPFHLSCAVFSRPCAYMLNSN